MKLMRTIDLLPLHKHWLALVGRNHRDGKTYWVLDGIPALSDHVLCGIYGIDFWEETLRRPPSKGWNYCKRFSRLVGWSCQQGQYGQVEPFRIRYSNLDSVLTDDADAAKPSYQEEYGRRHKTPWTDHFIDELKRGLVACKVFIFYPIYWLVYGQMLTNLISQGNIPFSLPLNYY